MVFSSMVFLWIFLPVVLLLYLAAEKFLKNPLKIQNMVLLLASLLFYAWGEPFYVLLLLVSIFLNWAAGRWMERYPVYKKGILIADIILNLGLLGYFKYCNFFLNTVDQILPFVNLPRVNIALPVGISFFTFQAMSYVIDLYRGRYPAQKKLVNVALYISFFPQLIAGPIVKYRDVETQIENRAFCADKMAEGIRRFIYGLGKKVVVANLLAQTADQLFALDAARLSPAMAWLAAISYTLQIYYDFSGYSDMAIGLGKMFGFEFLENFNYPYIASSVQDFWRRWHISLSSWFKEYLYIPLGGNRKGRIRTYINLFIVFAVTGLWHGASWNFVGWGLYHGIFLVIERMGFQRIVKRMGPLKYGYSFLVALVGWVFFRVESVGYALTMLRTMFWPFSAPQGTYALMPPETVTPLSITVLCLGLLGAGLLQKGPARRMEKKWKGSLAEAVFCVLLLFYVVLLLANDTYNPFIYFRF